MISRRSLLKRTASLGAAAGLAGWDLSALLHSQAATDTWGKDQLLRRSLHPPDYETPVALLNAFITPNGHFYVRSHQPVPAAADPARRLAIDGSVNSPLSLSLDDVKKLPRVTITTTLECAGNGRAFYDPPVAGIQWQKGAVGTARWTGARLADVLTKAGLKSSVKNIVMTPADRPPGTMPMFVRQIPLAKATHPDTLIAYEMNGVAIPMVHGFPLRAIVPGWEGAYSLKWLTSLTAIDGESDSFWVASGYRYPSYRVAPGAAVDAKDMRPLTGLAVKSLITQPLNGARLEAGAVRIGGFAWAGEADITRVEVSTDSGATWQAAQLVGEQTKYAWRRFEHAFTAAAPASYLIMSRATDSTGATQPVVSHWNPSGYLWNQYDSVRVEVGTPPAGAAPAAAPAAAETGSVESLSGAQTFARACSSCHETDLVDQQRLSRAGWQREIEKMVRWGARVPEAEQRSLIDYLLARLSRR